MRKVIKRLILNSQCFLSPGGSGADPGEAGAAFSRPAEARRNQRVLVRPGNHNQGKGPPTL